MHASAQCTGALACCPVRIMCTACGFWQALLFNFGVLMAAQLTNSTWCSWARPGTGGSRPPRCSRCGAAPAGSRCHSRRPLPPGTLRTGSSRAHLAWRGLHSQATCHDLPCRAALLSWNQMVGVHTGATASCNLHHLGRLGADQLACRRGVILACQHQQGLHGSQGGECQQRHLRARWQAQGARPGAAQRDEASDRLGAIGFASAALVSLFSVACTGKLPR
jgi:hypothetical protein